MGSLYHIDRVTDLRTWPGEFPVSHLYTYGIAGERFFRELKDNGRFMATRCTACQHVHVPPSIFCPTCFGKLEDWLEVGPQGTVRAVTIAHLDSSEERMATPETFAFIQLDGADGLLLHRLSGDAAIGARVEPVLKHPSAREGSILDIVHFRTL